MKTLEMRDKISVKLRGVCINYQYLSCYRSECIKLGAKSMLRHNTFILSSALKNS